MRTLTLTLCTPTCAAAAAAACPLICRAFLEQSPPAHTLLLVPLASGRELVLTVVRPPGSSSKKPGSSAGGGGGYPVLLGYLLRAGAAALAAELVESGRLVVELDLDDTLVKACTVSSLRADLAQRQREAEELAQVLAHMEAQQGAAAEAAEVAAQLAQARREMELRQADLQLLTDYMDTDCVTVDGQRQEAALEQEVSEAGELVERPVVRLDGGRKILTRPEAGNRYTSMMIHIRPGWDLLRAALLGDDAPPHADGTRKQRFRIAVCTTAQRGYALEAVRLLGLTPELIAPGQRQSRVVNVPSISGMPTKSLARVLAPVAAEQPEAVAALGSAVPLAVIVDDQPKVWDEASRGQVLQVAAWGYYREAALKQVAQGQAAGNKVPASENELVRVRDALMQLRSALFLSIMEVRW